ncbi:hypothetical protein BH23CHL7_BH23CHL7_09050 [soil metagenome]
MSEPQTRAEILARADEAWERFRAVVTSYPPEQMDARIGKGWSRKQMLAHIAAWHDSATDRLLAFAASGERQKLREGADAINGRVARAAAGRTAGEVGHAVDASFRRLRRQVEALTDEQLAAHDGWPVALIAGTTWEHYTEHGPDLEVAADLSSARD